MRWMWSWQARIIIILNFPSLSIIIHLNPIIHGRWELCNKWTHFQPVMIQPTISWNIHDGLGPKACNGFGRKFHSSQLNISKMKTPQLWRTSRDMHFVVLSPNWHHLVTSQDTVRTLLHTPGFRIRSTKSENPGNYIFDLLTLTFDLWPWLSNFAELSSRSSLIPIFGTVRQTVQQWRGSQTDRR